MLGCLPLNYCSLVRGWIGMGWYRLNQSYALVGWIGSVCSGVCVCVWSACVCEWSCPLFLSTCMFLFSFWFLSFLWMCSKISSRINSLGMMSVGQSKVFSWSCYEDFINMIYAWQKFVGLVREVEHNSRMHWLSSRLLELRVVEKWKLIFVFGDCISTMDLLLQD